MDGRDKSVPYAYGMYAADYPRTPTFTPRAPTVMRDCIYTIRCERAR